MRTTVTLIPEAERLLRQAMRIHGLSFKEVLNRAVLKGLADLRVEAEEEPFLVRGSSMGLRAGWDPRRLNALADDLEADEFVALATRLRQRSTEE